MIFAKNIWAFKRSHNKGRMICVDVIGVNGYSPTQGRD